MGLTELTPTDLGELVTTDFVQTRRRAAMFGLASLLVAGGTGFAVYSMASGYQAQIERATSPSAMGVAAVAVKALPRGAVIKLDDLKLAAVIPQGADPAQFFTTTDSAVGLVVAQDMLLGEALRKERVSDSRVGVPAEQFISPGYRAVTVKVDRAASVGGLLEPGFQVDLIVTIRPDNQSLGANWVTETILQSVRVLAMGDNTGTRVDARLEEKDGRVPTNRRYAYVTLEVHPEEAEMVALSAARGELQLSLRSRGDEELMEERGPLVTNALVGISEPVSRTRARRKTRPKKLAPPSTSTSAEVIEGGRVSTQTFDEAGRKLEDDKK